MNDAPAEYQIGAAALPAMPFQVGRMHKRGGAGHLLMVGLFPRAGGMFLSGEVAADGGNNPATGAGAIKVEAIEAIEPAGEAITEAITEAIEPVAKAMRDDRQLHGNCTCQRSPLNKRRARSQVVCQSSWRRRRRRANQSSVVCWKRGRPGSMGYCHWQLCTS